MAAGVMTSTTGLGGWGFLLLGGSIAGKPKLAVARQETGQHPVETRGWMGLP